MEVLRLPTHSLRCNDLLFRFPRKLKKTRLSLTRSYQQWQSSAWSTVYYLAVVATVAIYDIVLTILYARYLKDMEENPIGRWLMNLDAIRWDMQPDLTLFLTLKSLGTIFVLTTMYMMLLWRTRWAHPISIGVSSFQMMLAGYLTFATLPS